MNLAGFGPARIKWEGSPGGQNQITRDVSQNDHLTTVYPVYSSRRFSVQAAAYTSPTESSASTNSTLTMDTLRTQWDPNDVESNDDDVEDINPRREKQAEGCLKSIERRVSSAAKRDASSDQTVETPHPRKPRGRPKKDTPVAPVTPSFKKNGRSKTGCQTCRNRKKKCDELKPICGYSVDSWSLIMSSSTCER